MKITVPVKTHEAVLKVALSRYGEEERAARVAAHAFLSNAENWCRIVGPWWNRKRVPLGDDDVEQRLNTARDTCRDRHRSGPVDDYVAACSKRDIVTNRLRDCGTLERLGVKSVDLSGGRCADFLLFGRWHGEQVRP